MTALAHRLRLAFASAYLMLNLSYVAILAIVGHRFVGCDAFSGDGNRCLAAALDPRSSRFCGDDTGSRLVVGRGGFGARLVRRF